MFTILITPVNSNGLLLHTEVKEPQMAQLLQDYADIFKEPKSLPPIGVMIIGLSLKKVPHL